LGLDLGLPLNLIVFINILMLS